MITKIKKNVLIFWVITILFLIKGIYYCFYIPPWEAPDEPGHVNYVLFLYHNKSIPGTKIMPTFNGVHYVYQKNHILPKLQKGGDAVFNRNSFKLRMPLGTIEGNPPFYYLYLMPFYILSLGLNGYFSFIFLRFGSLLLGTFTVIFVYHIVKLLYPKSKTIPNLVYFLVAFQPMFTFMSSVVNSDSLVTLLFVLLMYVILRFIILAKNTSIMTTLLVLSVAGAAALTKPQMVIAIPIAISSLFFVKKTNINKIITLFLTSIAMPLIWYLSRYIQIGAQAFSYPFTEVQKYPLPLWKYPVAFILGKQPIGIFMSFWGYFGWINVPMPKFIYLLFFLIVLISVIGWVTYLREKNNYPKDLKRASLFLYFSSIIYIITIFTYDLLTYTKTYHFVIQGRYFMPILFIVILFILQGIMFYNKKLTKFFIFLCITILILSQVLMYISISRFYYQKLQLISPITSFYVSQK